MAIPLSNQFYALPGNSNSIFSVSAVRRVCRSTPRSGYVANFLAILGNRSEESSGVIPTVSIVRRAYNIKGGNGASYRKLSPPRNGQ
ncbi:unnamed protein product [Nezara viridula]|uniref:Uncharacterized protein n=1 Tax=Nezara viridula TaxID=85310 RepID=A0A9P0HFH4_NEZVI|nr:unnamed protein product [Nezara viridula]